MLANDIPLRLVACPIGVGLWTGQAQERSVDIYLLQLYYQIGQCNLRINLSLRYSTHKSSFLPSWLGIT